MDNHLGLALEAVLPCTKTDGLSVTVDMEVKKLVNQNSQNKSTLKLLPGRIYSDRQEDSVFLQQLTLYLF